MGNLCACGCSSEVTPGKTYRKGHHLRKPKPLVEPTPCLCGCGEFTTIWRGKPKRYVAGHQARGSHNSRFGKFLTNDTKERISEARKEQGSPWWRGRLHSTSSRQKMSASQAKNPRVGAKNHFFGKKHSAETKAKIAETKSKRPVLPTTPERYVHDELRRLGLEFLTEHPIGSFCVDVYIPSRRLVVFIDGCYWHACPTHHPTRKRPGSDNSRIPYFRAGEYNIECLWEHDIMEDVCRVMKSILLKYPAENTRML